VTVVALGIRTKRLIKLTGFYTYLHLRADDGLPFYAGKGCGYRAWSAKNRNKYWRHIVDKHGFLSLVVQEFDSEQDALDHEAVLIQELRNRVVSCANIVDGGVSGIGQMAKGVPKSPEHRAKISAAHKGKKKPWTDEQRAAKSLQMAGRKMPAEVRAKIGAANLGIKRTDETRARISAAKLSASAKRKQSTQQENHHVN
jgi:alkylated DNA nucleotide flippase Atl1